jgi:hypothetical protein
LLSENRGERWLGSASTGAGTRAERRAPALLPAIHPPESGGRSRGSALSFEYAAPKILCRTYAPLPPPRRTGLHQEVKATAIDFAFAFRGVERGRAEGVTFGLIQKDSQILSNIEFRHSSLYKFLCRRVDLVTMAR